MTSETPSSAFEHDPLHDSTTHFRLLHILRGDFGQHVECEISSWLIDDAPSYYAISYTWGDPADTVEITVNGKPLAVRRNCEYVLQQAFATKASRYYWVDAICIAQTNTQERNHQVGIMGKIYSGAKHVFACVGPHADDSEYLMATVDQQRPILEMINKWGQSFELYETFAISVRTRLGNPIVRHVRRQLRCLFTMHILEPTRMSKAFISFLQRPYFTRVWILQELHLATEMSYCCGSDVVPGEYFRALDGLLEYWMELFTVSCKRRDRCKQWVLQKLIPASRPSKEPWLVLQHKHFESIEPSRGCLRLAVSARKQHPIAVLYSIEGFHCVDVRDNLYGILSLVSWPDGLEPTPDYTKDNFEVAQQGLSIWSHGDICRMFEHRCSLLFKLFDVTLELASLRDAIALRSSVTPEADLRQHENRSSEFAKVSTRWGGIQISDDSLMCRCIGNRRPSGPSSCYMERERNGRFVWLRVNSTVSVCAPVDTKSGDWCLVADMHFPDPVECGLILRKSKDDEYIVVGPALARYWEDERDPPLANNLGFTRSFIGWSDPEDILVLAWTLGQLPYNKKISDKDMLEFVSMRVCGWKGSSCFEEILENHVSS